MKVTEGPKAVQEAVTRKCCNPAEVRVLQPRRGSGGSRVCGGSLGSRSGVGGCLGGAGAGAQTPVANQAGWFEKLDET